MTLIDAATVLFGLFAGYWVVSKLFFKHPPPAKAADASSNWYEILKVPATASTDEIKAAYRQLISQYHPDKVERLGVPRPRRSFDPVCVRGGSPAARLMFAAGQGGFLGCSWP